VGSSAISVMQERVDLHIDTIEGDYPSKDRIMSQLINGVPLDELERRMQPGGWSQEGFLTPEQPLAQVMAADAASLRQLGVTAEEIANSLEHLLERGAHSDRFRSVHIEQFQVQITHSHKMRTCPWAPKQFEWCHIGQGVKYLTTEYFEITNTRLGESLNGTSLCIHLIRDHSFFGGPGTLFRIDPERAVRVLELLSDTDNQQFYH
jgi:hypothetical protein